MEIQEEITEIYKLMKRIENMYTQQKKDLMYFHHVYDFDITTFLVTALYDMPAFVQMMNRCRKQKIRRITFFPFIRKTKAFLRI